MTSTPRVTVLRDDPRVLLPGLEYARSLIEIAIHVCRKEQVDLENTASGIPPPTKKN